MLMDNTTLRKMQVKNTPPFDKGNWKCEVVNSRQH